MYARMTSMPEFSPCSILDTRACETPRTAASSACVTSRPPAASRPAGSRAHMTRGVPWPRPCPRPARPGRGDQGHGPSPVPRSTWNSCHPSPACLQRRQVLGVPLIRQRDRYPVPAVPAVASAGTVVRDQGGYPGASRAPGSGRTPPRGPAPAPQSPRRGNQRNGGGANPDTSPEDSRAGRAAGWLFPGAFCFEPHPASPHARYIHVCGILPDCVRCKIPKTSFRG
jgi:hypothetical protein